MTIIKEVSTLHTDILSKEKVSNVVMNPEYFYSVNQFAQDYLTSTMDDSFLKKINKGNNYLNDYFGLHKDYNILPAFISLRMKKNGLVSHRRFAMLGSIVLKLFRTIALYASNDYDNDESTRLEVIGSNDFFIKQIKESDFIILSDFPFYKRIIRPFITYKIIVIN